MKKILLMLLVSLSVNAVQVDIMDSLSKDKDLPFLQDVISKITSKTGGFNAVEYAIPILNYAAEEALKLKLHCVAFQKSNLMAILNDVNEDKLTDRVRGLFNTYLSQPVRDYCNSVIGTTNSVSELRHTGNFVN